MLLERLYECGHGRSLLTDGNIDTVDGLASLVETLLIDDGVDGNSSLTRLTVANDKLALTTADGNHRVDSLQARLQGLLHGLAIDNARCLTVERHLEGSRQVDVTLSVDSLSEGIDDAAQHVVVDAYGGNALGALDNHTLLDA